MDSYSILNDSGSDLSRLISDVVGRVLKDVEVSIEDIRIEELIDEDVKIVVVLKYANAEDVTGSMLNDLTYKMRKKLVERGDVRYPFFDHTFHDNVKAAG